MTVPTCPVVEYGVEHCVGDSRLTASAGPCKVQGPGPILACLSEPRSAAVGESCNAMKNMPKQLKSCVELPGEDDQTHPTARLGNLMHWADSPQLDVALLGHSLGVGVNFALQAVVPGHFARKLAGGHVAAAAPLLSHGVVTQRRDKQPDDLVPLAEVTAAACRECRRKEDGVPSKHHRSTKLPAHHLLLAWRCPHFRQPPCPWRKLPPAVFELRLLRPTLASGPACCHQALLGVPEAQLADLLFGFESWPALPPAALCPDCAGNLLTQPKRSELPSDFR